MAPTSFTYPQDDTVSKSDGPTPWQTVGPFFHFALPFESGPLLVPEDHPDAVTLSGVLRDGEDQPVPDGLVEIWQAGPDGRFPERTELDEKPTGFRGFGRCSTDADGRYEFRTLKPAGVPTVDGTPQAPHVAMSVFARGMLRRVVTRVYFDDEPQANAADPLLTDLGPDRAATLVARRSGHGYHLDVRLQGPEETVFFED